MKVLITGSSGLIGSALVRVLTERGCEVRRMVRSNPSPSDLLWDPMGERIDLTSLEAIDAVVNLAGENLASGRWTPARKALFADSRILGTRLLSSALSQLARKPRVLLSASGVGYYGDRGDQLLEETAGPGKGFLPDLARDWEAATAGASEAGIRVVLLRFGVVLSAAGGALAHMLPPSLLCLGGTIGSGRQYMSWIALDEVVRAMLHAMDNESISGPVNLVTPNAVTNRQSTRALGRALHRPTSAHMPAAVARMVFGEMADELLLASARAVPKVLTETGYSFQHPEIEPALREILGS